ncbi:MAG: hypothetical protein Q4C70_00710 [Planctomycetia bacterium]|nr:hypothetical protein [Planctomycetia bacterium]
MWKGEPVVEGRIEFTSVDGKTASVADIIENRAHTVDIPPRKKIVRIFTYQKSSRMIDDLGIWFLKTFLIRLYRRK